MTIAVVYSVPTDRMKASPYSEAEEDTVESADEVAGALREKGAAVAVIPLTSREADRIPPVRADCIFNLIEWSGRELPLSIRAVRQLEETGIPVTGADPVNYEMTTDKLLLKKALDRYALPTPRWQELSTGNEPLRSDFCYPVIVKPPREHCSVGLTSSSVIWEKETLDVRIADLRRQFGSPVYVEEFIRGHEFQVTVLDRPEGLAVLPPAEIVFDKGARDAFLTYAGRWDEASDDYRASRVVLAALSPKLKRRIEDISRTTFRSLGFRDYARIDMRSRGDEAYILEANSNPGLGDSDEYGMTVSYKAVGMTFADVVWEIVGSCLRRNSKEKPSYGSAFA
ncbi:hypothetical protein M1555_03290 [Patescibacteria group bacterium]|nr:hypothetical protein [Patescibacteria group bacterium]